MSVGRLTRYSPGGGTCDLGPAYKNPGPPGPQGPIGPPGSVSQIIAGTGITISPPGGTGSVTISWINSGYSTGSGSTGSQGPPGPTGPVSTVAGPTGPQGIQGATGPQGLVGPTGPPGTGGGGGSGVSQIVAGSNITISPSGGTGVVTINSAGVAGPQGPQGIQGLQGSPGSAGPQGVQGNAGSQGPIGPQGATGPQGNPGPQGSQGLQGIQGPTGSNGVTQIIAGTNVTISPTNGLGAVTVNSSGGSSGVYIIKVVFDASGNISSVPAAISPSGTSILTPWSFSNTTNTITFTPVSGLRGTLGSFQTYAGNTGTSYLVSNIYDKSTAGFLNIVYTPSSGTYVIGGVTTSLSGAAASQNLYIFFTSINPTSIII